MQNIVWIQDNSFDSFESKVNDLILEEYSKIKEKWSIRSLNYKTYSNLIVDFLFTSCILCKAKYINRNDFVNQIYKIKLHLKDYIDVEIIYFLLIICILESINIWYLIFVNSVMFYWSTIFEFLISIMTWEIRIVWRVKV